MNNMFGDSFEYKLIYIFEINSETHKGLLKIGDTTLQTERAIDSLPPNCRELNQAALKRIKQYTNTVGVTPKLLHTELAVRTIKDSDGKWILKAFRDHDVHRVLINSNIEKKKIKNSTSQEWFEVDLQTVLKAIEAVKKCKPNLGHDRQEKSVPIVFRPEQNLAINKTVKHFKNSDRMLWNAKMRFGKTLSALKVIKECKFSKTIIITHRPVVDKGWFEDFNKIFYDVENYIYGSKNNGATIDYLLSTEKNFVYFASLQDLRGSEKVGGKHDKNDDVFKIEWDLVIVDEAHEGTTTALGNEVIKNVVKKNTKLLALSGTPFNILNEYEENIYTWDYVMEQQAKKEWDIEHFGDSNPYDELPELKIYTYNLGKIMKDKKYVELEDKAFNFREFFRIWTGDIRNDHSIMPDNKQIGDFYHEEDIWQFLNLITKEDGVSHYPYANEKYRKLFKHSLWMVPGVREAKALSKLMRRHPIFGNGAFDIINVAGDGDEEEKSEDALNKVRKGIKSSDEGYTITLSCGKLTTGVTVPEWTAVFMLAGSFSTSASNYLQTIFRVQSPCNINGKIKKCCYVFDFAPDRTLKMIAESVALSTKAGKATESDKKIMGEFLNYCPVICVDGTMMKQYDTNKLLQQLKRAYAERAVKNGFDDTNLYNDELLKLDEVDIRKFNNLRKLVGSSKSVPKTNEIKINDQGFTDEEYDKIDKENKKTKSQRTPAEEELIKRMNDKKKQKATAISILRAISIRMPLLIYGADVDIDEDFTIDKLLDDNIVDPASWTEFMPTDITKEIFKGFIKYYDPEIFVEAGRIIRNKVKGADKLLPVERIKVITELFAGFKNPDKETVLTPWRVVNMHMGDCLGGYNFYNKERDVVDEEPRYIDNGTVTKDTVSNSNAQILEINSKTGLYPLYVTYSIFRARCAKFSDEKLTFELQEQLWNDTVQENMFVICKTPMAKHITKRTLVGYKNIDVNAHYFDDLINMMKNKSKQFIERVTKADYWKKKGQKMKFDAIVGNPPYQESTGGAGVQAKPIYQLFTQSSKKLNPTYLSMIIPSRWFAGGMGLDEFRDEMLNDGQIVKYFDFTNAKDCFPNSSIGGGVGYFLWSKGVKADCEFVNVINGKSSKEVRSLSEFEVLIRYNLAVDIIRKIFSHEQNSLSDIVSSLTPFGLPTNYRGKEIKSIKNDISLYSSAGISYISKDEIVKGYNYLDQYKVMVSKMGAEHAGEPNKDGQYRVLTSTMRVLLPNEACTHSYFLIGGFDNYEYAQNVYTYLKTKFVRFLILQALSAVNLSKSVFRFVPHQDFSRAWTDKELYSKYNLAEDEINFIESMIRSMD